MPRMLKFKLNRECREVAVNPAKILYICHYEHNASTLHFGKDCFVRVQGTLDEVASRLDEALGDGGRAAPEAGRGVASPHAPQAGAAAEVH